MNEIMNFPKTFEEFADEYGFYDNKEIYTNDSQLIPVFRVKQWLEHINNLKSILGITISKLDFKNNDIILVTIDSEIWGDIKDVKIICKVMEDTFPNNKVLFTFKGIEINKLKEKEI